MTDKKDETGLGCDFICDIKQKLEAEKESLRGAANPQWQEIGSDEDDAIAEVEMYETSAAMSLNVQKRIEEIDEALARIDQGAYGTCEHCGLSIPKDRLEAEPTATKCTEC